MANEEHADAAGDRRRGLAAIVAWIDTVIAWIAHPALTQVVLRAALAVPFWRSGILKWDGFLQLNSVAVLLFSTEFKLYLPGGPYPFPAPALFAFAAGCAEIVLPILLVLGLGTRIAAIGLLAMVAVVQLTVPSGWPVHLTWAAMALALMAWGPGAISLDAALTRYLKAGTPQRQVS